MTGWKGRERREKRSDPAVHPTYHAETVLFRLPRAVPVGGAVEVGEEEEEEHAVQADPDHEAFRVVALGEEQLELVGHDHDELDDLQRRQVLLPPDVLVVPGAHRRDHVVEVHDDVDERVEQGEERAVPAWKGSGVSHPCCHLSTRILTRGELHAHPDAERHAPVVDHVQRAHMVVLLPQHEKERVEELCELGEVVPPAGAGHAHRHRAVGVVDGLAPKAVAAPPAALEVLVEDPRAEHGLEEVVRDERPPQAERLPVLHQPRSEPLHDVRVRDADRERRQRRRHHEPPLHPGVCEKENRTLSFALHKPLQNRGCITHRLVTWNVSIASGAESFVFFFFFRHGTRIRNGRACRCRVKAMFAYRFSGPRLTAFVVQHIVVLVYDARDEVRHFVLERENEASVSGLARKSSAYSEHVARGSVTMTSGTRHRAPYRRGDVTRYIHYRNEQGNISRSANWCFFVNAVIRPAIYQRRFVLNALLVKL